MPVRRAGCRSARRQWTDLFNLSLNPPMIRSWANTGVKIMCNAASAAPAPMTQWPTRRFTCNPLIYRAPPLRSTSWPTQRVPPSESTSVIVPHLFGVPPSLTGHALAETTFPTLPRKSRLEVPDLFMAIVELASRACDVTLPSASSTSTWKYTCGLCQSTPVRSPAESRTSSDRTLQRIRDAQTRKPAQ